MPRLIVLLLAFVAIGAGCSSDGRPDAGDPDGDLVDGCVPPQCGACVPTLHVRPIDGVDGGALLGASLSSDAGSFGGCAPSGTDNRWTCFWQVAEPGSVTVTVSAPGYLSTTVTGEVVLPDASVPACGCAWCPEGHVDALLTPCVGACANCLGNGAACTDANQCCAMACKFPSDGGSGVCGTGPLTGTRGDPCTESSDCVAGLGCEFPDGGSIGTCQP